MSTTDMGGPKPPPRVTRQDMPPKGGFDPVDVRRNVPKSVTTRSSIALFALGGLGMAWGFYRVGQANVHRRELRQERKDIRLAIMPLLQAEEDARFVDQISKYGEWEKKVMKDVKDWNPDRNVYKTKTFMQPFQSTPAFSR